MKPGKTRILLVEDDEGHAGLIGRAFESRAPHVTLTVATTLARARQHLAHRRPDLLIADMLLPDGLGVELLPGDEASREFPAIVMTSFGNEQAAVDALKAGAIDYVVKSEMTLTDMPHIAERALREWENIAERKRAEEALRYRADFERVISGLSSDFVHLGPEQVDDGIQRALETIGRFAEVDRSYVFLLRDDDATVDNTHEWCAEGVESQMAGLRGIRLDEEVPWLAERFRNLEDVHIPVVSALPPEAEAEKGIFQAGDIQSLVTVPMVSGDRLKGFLGFDSVRSEKQWPDDATALLRIVGEIFINALQRKRAEEALRKSEENYRLLIENQTDMIVKFDVDGRLLFVSPSYCRTFGKTEEELLGKTFMPLVHEEDRAAVTRAIEAVHKPPHTGYVRERAMTKDGWRWQAWANTGVLNERGEVVEIVAAGRDITERKRVEEALRDGESRLAMAIECTGLGLWDHDFKTGSVTRGDNWMRMLGYEPEEVDPDLSAWMQLIHPDDKPHVERCAREYEAGLTPIFSVEHRMRTKSGQWKWIRNWGGIIQRDEDGKPIRAMGVHLDVNESKRAAEELARAKTAAESANRAKSEFLANMSHEIRTPMTAIMGFTDLLMSYEMPRSERREHLQTVHRNAESLLTVINDILDLSKIEADKIELEYVDCAPQEIVDEVVLLMKVRSDEKNLGLDAEYVYPLPATIRTDAVRLRQILVNLVGNAVKFTEQGRVQITVRYSAGSEGGLCHHRRDACATAGEGSPPQLVIDVTDTGIGMEPEDLGRLFQPFVQVDASHTRRFGGTGLGLSISGRLAEMLGGRIDVQSRLDRGSTFTVSIDPGPMDNVPLLDSRPSAVDVRQPLVDLPPGQVLSGRVLLVEDSPDIQHMVLLVLQHWGLEADVASNGRIACEKALQSKAVGSPYDLILMDIQLPEMDGYQATQYLRHHDWTGPIVALTAHAMSGDRQRCLAAGCDDYVPKPISAEELLETLAGYLGNEPAVDTQSAERPVGKRPLDRPLGSGILDDAEMAELVSTFLGELPKRAKAIQEALSAQDLPALTLRTHQLKGTAAIYGLAQISQAAALANQRASQPDDFEQLEAAVTELIGLCRAAVSHSFGRSPEEETRKI